MEAAPCRARDASASDALQRGGFLGFWEGVS